MILIVCVEEDSDVLMETILRSLSIIIGIIHAPAGDRTQRNWLRYFGNCSLVICSLKLLFSKLSEDNPDNKRLAYAASERTSIASAFNPLVLATSAVILFDRKTRATLASHSDNTTCFSGSADS